MLPRGKQYDPVFACWYSLNGKVETTGATWAEDSGFLEGPVMITNTHSVGVVCNAVEEAIVNALVTAESLTGVNGNTVYELPHQRLRTILRKYNRLQE